MATVNPTYWGEPLTEFWGYNVRTGASDLTDNDYTDYPPFVKNNMNPDFTDAPYTLRAAINKVDSGWVLGNEYPDISVAYCGMKNPNLPQCNIRAFGTAPDTSQYDYSDLKPCFETNPNEIKPVMFVTNRRINVLKTEHSSYPALTSDYFYNPLFKTSGGVYNNGIYFWCPNPRDEEDYWSRQCTAADIGYYRSIGLRTVFGVIYVQYYDTNNTYSNGTPRNSQISTLYAYSQQTEAWKETHPINGAYMEIVYRQSTSGLYDKAVVSLKDSITTDILQGMKINTSVVSEYTEDTEIIAPSLSVPTDSVGYRIWLFGMIGMQGRIQVGSNYGGGMSSGNYGLVIGTNIGTVKQGESSGVKDQYIFIDMPGTDENLELLRKAAAANGLFFTDGNASDSGYADLFAEGHDNDRWYNNKMCLGVVDSNGYTDGTYTRGLLNVTAPNWSWKTTDQSPYDPSLPPVPENHYSTQTEFNSIGDLASLTKRYVLNATGVESLGAALWDITADLIDNGGTPDYSELNEKILDQFLTNNPIDCIVGLQRYPMTIPTVGTDTVKLGKTDTGISCKPMEKTAYYYLFNGNTIAPKFGDSFLDYEPYTKMELYVPFCGTIQLNPADILNRKLNVQLAVDFTTGTATGFIMSDDLVIETVNGNIAIDLPITGIQAATVASQLNNAIANKMNRSLTRETATLGRISVQGLLRTISNPLAAHNEGEIAKNEETRADYELTHQNAPVHIIGSASAVGGWCIDLKCRLLIYYPTGEILRNANPPEWDNTQLARYGKNTGFACCMERSIGSMDSGLVLGINPDLSGMVTNSAAANPATASELEMIRSAIAEGVIVPSLT